jgi:molybdenum cofactor cytidylyltransferase
VRPESLRRVADALKGQAVVLPFHRGARGHPVGFGVQCRDALMALTGAEGAASIVRQHQPLRLELEDVGIVTDIDTVDDLAAAERLLAQH